MYEEDNLNGTTRVEFTDDTAAKKAQLPRHDDTRKKKDPTDLPDFPLENPNQKPPIKVDTDNSETEENEVIHDEIGMQPVEVLMLQQSQMHSILLRVVEIQSNNHVEIKKTLKSFKNWISDMMDKVTSKDKEQDVRKPKRVKTRSKTNTRAKPLRKKSKRGKRA